MKDKCVLTSEGFLELEAELNELKTIRRPEVIIALKEARAMGDLSENADYDAARNEQARIEAKIKDLEYKLDHCEIAKSVKNTGKVGLGSIVGIKYEDGEEEEYKIVSSVETDLFNNKISNESPLGSALLNHKVGDNVNIESPNGIYSVEITKVA
ncbi:MAG: transcription elongation factor GreA [bacterium]